MPKAKQSLKEKVEGNELDLSMNELTSLPMDEMLKLTKVTELDLSCNLLVTLPENFCKMRHIAKLDLSKNYLTELPASFGDLTALQHLDLLCNKLHLLPLSFAQLANLKWLDLKDNPLEPNLQIAAGDCSDESQCRKCAQNIIRFMQHANKEVERQQELELKREIAKENERKRQEEEKRILKKAEKEKRRQDFLEKQQTVEKLQASPAKKASHKHVKTKKPEMPLPPKDTNAKDPSTKWSFVIISTVVGVLGVMFGVYCYCVSDRSSHSCRRLLATVNDKLIGLLNKFNITL